MTSLPTKQTIFGVITTGTVLALILWVTQFDGLNSIKSLLAARRSIEIRGTGTIFGSSYFAGQKLRFGLKGANTAKVFWLVDDSAVLASGVEVEYVFPRDTTDAPAVMRTHRVDAVYREGKSYDAVTRFVDLEPSPALASFQLDGSLLRVSVQESISTSGAGATAWHLEGAALTTYDAGKYADVALLKPANGPDQTNTGHLLYALDLNMAKTLTTEPLYTEYRYTSGKDTLIMVQPVSGPVARRVDSLTRSKLLKGLKHMPRRAGERQ